MHGQIRPQELHRSSPSAVGQSLHWDLWPCEIFRDLPWLQASAPRLFFPMETWEQGKKAGLTSVSPAMELGDSQDMHLDWGTWKRFQVLCFRHHNRSVMYFYPQVHFQHHMYANSAGIHPDYLSIYTRKQPEAGQPRNRQCR